MTTDPTDVHSYQHQHRDSVLRSAATTHTQNWSMRLPASASRLCAPISCNHRYTELEHAVTSISIGTLCSNQLQQHIHSTEACSYQHQHQDSVLRSAATTHTQNWSMQLPASASGLCAPISCNNRYTELKHAVTSISIKTLCSNQLQQQIHRTGACSYHQHQHHDSVLQSAATTHTALKHAVTSISIKTLCSNQL